MITFGYSFLGGKNSAQTTAYPAWTPNAVAIENAIYDQLYVSNSLNNDTSEPLPLGWDYETVLSALFRDNLKAGNFMFTADEIMSVRIKRKEDGKYNWITIDERPIEVEEDLDFTITDYLARGNQYYDYALVPVKNDGTEGVYNTNRVFSDFNGLWVYERDIGYNALLDLEMSSTRNQVTSSVVTIGRRYPFVNKYGKPNYYTGSFSTTFIFMNKNNCQLEVSNGVKYREEVEQFLMDGKPKIIKHMDGRIWLAMITDEISKEEGDGFKIPMQTVNFTEIGPYDSSYDLYYAGLIDVNVEPEVVDDELLS